ncbi:MAG TPA: 3-oxoacyl-ACP reductase FabG [Deltaproteobacteria bacterium]|nr:3-oxoacyl-ACP reductase FabG [Deltaproteobacteria bacterium]
MKIELGGKVALVTGASRGIGRAAAAALARAGAAVVVNYRRSSEAALELGRSLSEEGCTVETFKADVSSPDEIEALFGFVEKRFAGLDILVNNAGVIKDTLLAAMRLREWDAVAETNLRGPFLCTRRAVEMMMPRGGGKIINISSVAAVRGGRGQTNYAAAKGGLVAFTRAAAVELAPKNIQINAVLPGMIVTDMSARVRKRAGDRLVEAIPAGRFGEPDDVAGLIVFLASGHADYITGQAVAVDGGMSVA